MFVSRFTVAVATLVALASLPAQAVQNGITYDCDTAAEHYSDLVLPAPSGPFVVRGQVKLNAIAGFEKYMPMTGVSISEALERPGASSKEAVGFKLTGVPAKKLGIKTKDKDAVLQFFNWDEIKAGSAADHAPQPLPDDQGAVPFDLSYDGKSVTMHIAGKQQSFALNAATPVVRLICSTGEFLYTDLTIQPR